MYGISCGSFKNSLYNLDLTETAQELLKKRIGVKLDTLYELEPDAGLGNGGLGGWLPASDGLATASVPAIGYSLLYEYGIFRQKLVDGWQTELPDYWLPGGGELAAAATGAGQGGQIRRPYRGNRGTVSIIMWSIRTPRW